MNSDWHVDIFFLSADFLQRISWKYVLRFLLHVRKGYCTSCKINDCKIFLLAGNKDIIQYAFEILTLRPPNISWESGGGTWKKEATLKIEA